MSGADDEDVRRRLGSGGSVGGLRGDVLGSIELGEAAAAAAGGGGRDNVGSVGFGSLLPTAGDAGTTAGAGSGGLKQEPVKEEAMEEEEL